jgi:hypothetical protein
MRISVTAPFSLAIATAKRILFEPFDLGKWLRLGFCAFLMQFATGGGGSFNFNVNNFGSRKGGGVNFDEMFREAQHFFNEHAAMILIVGGILLVLIVTISLLLAWVGSRGVFMYLDGIVKNRGAVVEPWHNYRAEGNSLFKFNLVFGFGSMILFFLVGGICALMVWHGMAEGDFSPLAVVGLVAFFMFLFVFLLVVLSVRFLLLDFVVPAMYRRRIRVQEAWRIVYATFRPHLGDLALLSLFEFVLVMGVGVCAIMVTCLTCCIAMIPYVGSVILLPLTVFIHAYQLHYLEQYGPDWKFFPDSGEAPPAFESDEPPAATVATVAP